MRKKISTSEISFFTHRGLEFLLAEDIIRCKAISNYTCLYTEEKKLVIAKCLCDFEKQLLPHGFMRPNRSELFNINFIKKIQYNSHIELQDGSVLKISRRRRKDLESQLIKSESQL
jgi:DNA-binding LytR/AlgR family response regulator